MKHSKPWSILRLTAMLLVLVMLVTTLAAAAKQPIKYSIGSYTVEKVSNPTAGEKEIDGLENGGDRLNSYSWSMAALSDKDGDYLYVGSVRGMLNKVMEAFTTALSGQMGEENTKTLGHVLFVDDVPSCTTAQYEGGTIVRYNMKTGEMETWFDADKNRQDSDVYRKKVFGFRSAITFQNAVYMNAMTEAGGAIYRISSNDQELPEVVLRGTGNLTVEDNSQDLRAMAVSTEGNTLYVAGVQGVAEPDRYDFNIVAYQSTDGTKFDQIADYRDFEFYEMKNGGFLSTTGVVWDIIEYKNELYMTVVTLRGGLVFKGHKAAQGESGNAYGWVWEELCGMNGGQFGTGFGNPLNQTMTPYKYDGDLYFLTLSDVIDPIINYGLSMGEFMADDGGNISVVLDSFKGIEKVLLNETSLYRLTDEGKWQMTMGDRDKCAAGIEYVAELGSGFHNEQYGTNGYSWRAATYNGKMYIGTLDVTFMYKYITKLSNGELLNMNSKDFRAQLEYLVSFLKGVSGNRKITLGNSVFTTKLNLLGTKLSDSMINSLINVLTVCQSALDKEATVDMIEYLLMTLPRIKSNVTALYSRVELLSKLAVGSAAKRQWSTLLQSIGTVKAALDAIDTDGLESYVRVSRVIADNLDNSGFNLYCTTDGVNFETITVDGFNDRYNAGARTLLGTEYGLMIGTANPFYGAQLWKLTENEVN